MEDTAPPNHTMKIQLDVCAELRPSWPATATWSGTAPNANHTKAVRPAQKAAGRKSRIGEGKAIVAE